MDSTEIDKSNDATTTDVELVEVINVENTVEADVGTDILNSKLKWFVIEYRNAIH